MIIDMILDRKDGFPYDARKAYDYVSHEEQTIKMGYGIARAMDSGTNADVQEALCKYVEEQGYNANLCKYILSVNWVDEEKR